MSKIAKVTPAPVPKTKDVQRISIFYAVVLVVMVVAQLFTFDTFIELYGPIIAALLVVFEVFALPFLLRMPLSRAFRWVSMVSGWLVAALWIGITSWLITADVSVGTVGFLGTAIDTIPGWWAVFMSFAFALLAAWSAWGMWPAKHSAKRKK